MSNRLTDEQKDRLYEATGVRVNAVRDHPYYPRWNMAKYRCRNKKAKNYPAYGGRGIQFSRRFDGIEGFVRYCEELGRQPSDQHSVDRINNERGYCVGNIHWSTPFEQANNRRNTLLIRHKGGFYTMEHLSVVTGVPLKTLKWRYYEQGLRGRRLVRPTYTAVRKHKGSVYSKCRSAIRRLRQDGIRVSKAAVSELTKIHRDGVGYVWPELIRSGVIVNPYV